MTPAQQAEEHERQTQALRQYNVAAQHREQEILHREHKLYLHQVAAQEEQLRLQDQHGRLQEQYEQQQAAPKELQEQLAAHHLPQSDNLPQSETLPQHVADGDGTTHHAEHDTVYEKKGNIRTTFKDRTHFKTAPNTALFPNFSFLQLLCP